ncbi:ribosomal protein L21 (chloroplast) [Galdieria partita]|uniref:Large ribosomal subunit protein bL21c n=1 Tax=Galdieria partita TaxID=83374 RepID=A0A9C7BH70_9RHOD|nr:ribosomal protein L21 [Galdieria partita]
MTYAIIENSGRQFFTEPGRFIDINHVKAEVGDIIYFNRVLLLKSNNVIEIGYPFINKIKVKAKILKHFKDKKIRVYKMNPKKGTRKTKGYRSLCTRVLIESIENTENILK